MPHEHSGQEFGPQAVFWSEQRDCGERHGRKLCRLQIRSLGGVKHPEVGWVVDKDLAVSIVVVNH